MLKGLNPVWHDTMVFKVHAPELAFVIFTVFVKNLSIAHYALPYRCIQQGYLTCIVLFFLLRGIVMGRCCHFEMDIVSISIFLPRYVNDNNT